EPSWRAGPARHLQFWNIQLHCPAALSVAEVDLRTLDPQLGMGHCISHPCNYHGAVAAAYLQHEVIAADAEDPAADESHPGEIQALQHYRPAQSGHAERNAGAVQKRRRKSSGRLFSVAAANAVPVCFLLHAE